MAYLSSAVIVVSSFLMALAASSINDIWSWFIMSLTAGALGPGLLRLYWWRTNAWGMVSGLLAGGAAGVLPPLGAPGLGGWSPGYWREALRLSSSASSIPAWRNGFSSSP